MPFVAFLLNQVVASSPFQSGAGWLFARKNTGGTITTGADRNSLERISLFMGQRSHLIAWMGKHWPRLLVGMSMAALVAMAAVSAGPLRSAIEIGGDEHCEVTKGFLWAKGYSLYEKVWSDQPPLYTALLGTLFQYFGATIGVARSLAVGFGFLLLTGCFVLVKQGGATGSLCGGGVFAGISSGFADERFSDARGACHRDSTLGLVVCPEMGGTTALALAGNLSRNSGCGYANQADSGVLGAGAGDGDSAGFTGRTVGGSRQGRGSNSCVLDRLLGGGVPDDKCGAGRRLQPDMENAFYAGGSGFCEP